MSAKAETANGERRRESIDGMPEVDFVRCYPAHAHSSLR